MIINLYGWDVSIQDLFEHYVISFRDFLYEWPYSEYVEYHYIRWVSPCSTKYYYEFI